MTPAQAFLNRIEIASPCPADWAEMEGDDRARFCAECEKHVYDLSTLTATSAMDLIREKEGTACVRLWRRADGTVMTADCRMGMRRLASRGRMRVPMPIAALMTLALAIGCAEHPSGGVDESVPPSVIGMGFPMRVDTRPPEGQTMESMALLPLIRALPWDQIPEPGQPKPIPVTSFKRKSLPSDGVAVVGLIANASAIDFESTHTGKTFSREDLDHLPLN